MGPAVAHRQRDGRDLTGLVPAEGLGVDRRPIQEQLGPIRVHRLREADFQGAAERDRLLSVGERRVIEGCTGDFWRGFGVEAHRVVLAAESHALAGAGDLDPVGGIRLQLRVELEVLRIADDHGVGDRRRDLETALYRGDIHVLVEGDDHGGAADDGVVAVGDAGTHRQRCGQRSQHKPGGHQHEDDRQHPPAAAQRSAEPAIAGDCLTHLGTSSA